jgi:RNA exonuclease 1
MAKKRSQETSPSSAESPKYKKMKTNDDTLDQSVEHDGEGWTKVEKRKHKKTKKAAVKTDVSVLCFSPNDVWSSKI